MVTIIGLSFNERGVDVTETEIQTTWRRYVEAERLHRLAERKAEDEAMGAWLELRARLRGRE